MKTRASLGLAASVVFIVVLAACSAPAAPSLPAPAPGASGLKQSSDGPAWEADWEKTLAEAKKEGKVVVYGPAGGDLRFGLIDAFRKAYPDIMLDYLAMEGSQVAPKITTERNAGLFIPDVHFGGPATILLVLKKYAVPLEEFLVLPEVKETRNWLNNKLWYADREMKYVLAFAVLYHPLIAYNPTLLNLPNPESMSLWEFTEPKWKGNFVWHDPRAPGFGRGMGWFAYHNPKLGQDWFRAIARNEVVISRDARLLMEWVARGRYPLMIGPDQRQLTEFINQGLPVKAQFKMREGAFAGLSTGYLMLFDRMPHPNATKVFVNWFLSREGQLVHSKATGFGSIRVDIPTDHLIPESVVKTGDPYPWMFGEEGVEGLEKSGQFAFSVFGR